jgi:hypothetical protein
MTTTTMLVTQGEVTQLVALVLAKAAARTRRGKRKSSYSRKSLKEIQRDIVALKLGNPYGDGWYELHKELEGKGGKCTSIRKALKHWEAKGKVTKRRGGRYGNSYRWTLLCETNQWDRSKRKRKARDKSEAARKAALDLRTAESQAIADRLAKALSVPTNVIKTYGDSITIHKDLINAILIGWIGEEN